MTAAPGQVTGSWKEHVEILIDRAVIKNPRKLDVATLACKKDSENNDLTFSRIIQNSAAA